jgi:hypothetical protein
MESIQRAFKLQANVKKLLRPVRHLDSSCAERIAALPHKTFRFCEARFISTPCPLELRHVWRCRRLFGVSAFCNGFAETPE